MSSKTPEAHSWRVIGPSNDVINLMSGGMVKFTLFDWECGRCGSIIRSSREDRRIGPPPQHHLPEVRGCDRGRDHGIVSHSWRKLGPSPDLTGRVSPTLPPPWEWGCERCGTVMGSRNLCGPPRNVLPDCDEAAVEQVMDE